MTTSLELAYNTDQLPLTIPEYGRNVYQMIKHAIAIEDKKERTKCAETIVKVMALINPSQKDKDDYKQRLWAHLYIISEFKLDIECPYETPKEETYSSKPEDVPYPKNDIRFGHYGKIMEDMVKAATIYPEGEEKKKLIKHIANLLKTSYLQWNRDSVNDDLIIKQLGQLSDGKLTIDASELRETADILKHYKKKRNISKNYSKNKNRRKYNGSF